MKNVIDHAMVHIMGNLENKFWHVASPRRAENVTGSHTVPLNTWDEQFNLIYQRTITEMTNMYKGKPHGVLEINGLKTSNERIKRLNY